MADAFPELKVINRLKVNFKEQVRKIKFYSRKQI